MEGLLPLALIILAFWWFTREDEAEMKRRSTRRPSRSRRPPIKKGQLFRYVPGGDNRDLRRKLIRAQQGKCAYCPKRLPMNPPVGSWHERNWDYPTIDHVIPQARGGSHEYHNLRACCWGCNVKKGTRTFL